MSNQSLIKRILSGILAVHVLMAMTIWSMPVMAESSDAQEPEIEIYDSAGLAAISDHPDGSYKLAADIDLSGIDWHPIPFCGKLDGCGYTIYNLTVTSVGDDTRISTDGNLIDYDTEFAGLFSSMENAEITNLGITGARIDIMGSTHCFAAILAGYSDRCTVTGCSVSGHVYLQNHGVNAGVGGFVGFGTGYFDSCTADVELIFEDCYLEDRCEQFLGGIFSCGIGNITNCSVKIQGYDSCHGYAHNGGLVGLYYYCNTHVLRGYILNNTIQGQISFFEDNEKRRAFCKPVAGEIMSLVEIEENESDFIRNEVFDYAKVLMPEKCQNPDYAETVIPSGCTEWGYTQHKCGTCGYSWRDTYTAPHHEAGEWVIQIEPDADHKGLRKKYCAKCGQLLEEEFYSKSDEDVSVRHYSLGKLNNWLLGSVSGGLVIVVAVGIVLLRKRKSHSSQNSAE